VPEIAAFLTVAAGDPVVPVHYPRVRPLDMDPTVRVPPDPRGNAYAWFAQNDQQRAGGVLPGRGLSLPVPGVPLRVHPGRPASPAARAPRPQRGG
jgi:hypothetical protein